MATRHEVMAASTAELARDEVIEREGVRCFLRRNGANADESYLTVNTKVGFGH